MSGFSLRRFSGLGLSGACGCRIGAFLLVVVAWLGFVLPLAAHNPDTSYARIEISDTQVEFRLTYDLFTLLKVAALDDNQDRRVSRDELTGHADEIARFLQETVLIDINLHEADLGEFIGPVWPPNAGEAIDEADYHAAAGLVAFRFVKAVGDTPEDVTVTFDFFKKFGDRHTVIGVFVHAGQDHEVTFNRFEPDYLYDTGYQPPVWKRMLRFLKLGVEHIFLGYDHICFLIALIVVSRWRELVWIVTAFTVAHSITLILAALGWVHLSTRWVECAIALTIVYVAAENIWLKSTRHRWMLAFGFGLIHGFGFANVLREMGLPTTGLVRCLLAFNLGAELGQLAIVIMLLPLTIWLGRWRYGRRVGIGVSLILAGFGILWFLDRAFNLQFMPF